MTPSPTPPLPTHSSHSDQSPSDPHLIETSDQIMGMPLDRAQFILPDNLLQGGEVIILLLKPSLWFILLGCLHTLSLTILAAMTLWAVIPLLPYPYLSRNDIIIITLIIIGLRVFWQILEWLGRIYVLTDQRIIRIRGVIRIRIFETRLNKLQHTDLLLSLRERIFYIGTIAFSTAGSYSIEAYWEMINKPTAVHQQIIQTINRANHSP